MGGGIMKAIKLMILGILGVSLTLVSVVSAADWYVPGDFHHPSSN
jgi:hypothetical protein